MVTVRVFDSFYYIGKSVLVENTPLVKFKGNFIRDSSGLFSISSLVMIDIKDVISRSYTVVCAKYSCPYNKKKITRWLEDMNFIFSW